MIARNATDARWEQLNKYVHDTAELLGLGGFHFFVSYEAPDNDETVAETDTESCTAMIILKFRDDFFDYQPANQEWTVLHELLHVVQSEEAIERARMGHYCPAELVESERWLNERFIDKIALLLTKTGDYPNPNLTIPESKTTKKVGHVPHIVTPTVRGGCDL